MEFTGLGLLLDHGCVWAPAVAKQSYVKRRRSRRRCSAAVRAVMVRPQEEAPATTETAAAAAAMSMTTTTVTKTMKAPVYRDNWFDELAIGYLSRNLQEASGLKNEKDGYEGLIDAALAISRIFSLNKQGEIVTQALEQALPSYILTMIKVMMPPSRFSRECFAAFTTIFFPWLVGPCEVYILHRVTA
ncbi:hypothetical protein GUJ93_ZPchr0011g27691 [Zizania palustris]|uniref:Beta-carotene isomerase D27-like C-terminal domain-containing protein n=1 Tax=Zizania palustris TaxID=103762 RepID=A0A8J5WF70_ZIZPA|nr:hypothetical protein GUJ93_ZPchr0011g27691 [Zizania palustris]